MLFNFKINMQKSEVLNLTLTANRAATLKASFPFRWTQTSLKYFGISDGTPGGGGMYKENFVGLLATIRKDMAYWNNNVYLVWME